MRTRWLGLAFGGIAFSSFAATVPPPPPKCPKDSPAPGAAPLASLYDNERTLIVCATAKNLDARIADFAIIDTSRSKTVYSAKTDEPHDLRLENDKLVADRWLHFTDGGERPFLRSRFECFADRCSRREFTCLLKPRPKTRYRDVLQSLLQEKDVAERRGVAEDILKIFEDALAGDAQALSFLRSGNRWATKLRGAPAETFASAAEDLQLARRAGCLGFERRGP